MTEPQPPMGSDPRQTSAPGHPPVNQWPTHPGPGAPPGPNPQNPNPQNPYPQNPYPQNPYPQHANPQNTYPPAGWAPPVPRSEAALPTRAVRYAQLLRGSNWRWWRPLAAIGIFVPLAAILTSLISVPAVIAAPNMDVDAIPMGSPVVFASVTLGLAALIPVAIFAIWAAFGVRPGFVSSVAGRFRWRWSLRVALVALPIWAVLLGVSAALGGFEGGRHPNWAVLMVMVVLIIPFQAAGEEFAFRGFLQLTVGSFFRNPWLALIVPAVLSVPLFAAAHGSFDGFVFVDLSISAAAWVYLTWRTGGLEAAIVLHAINNVSVMLVSLVLGGFEAGFVGTDSAGDWTSVLTTAATMVVAVALVEWQARRAGIQPLFEPRRG